MCQACLFTATDKSLPKNCHHRGYIFDKSGMRPAGEQGTLSPFLRLPLDVCSAHFLPSFLLHVLWSVRVRTIHDLYRGRVPIQVPHTTEPSGLGVVF